MLQVTTPSPEQSNPTSISVKNVISKDSPFLTDHFPLQLDPAYLERLNEAFVTVKCPRSYVSVINSLSLIVFECASSRPILSKDGLQTMIHFLLRCCNGKVMVIISQWSALSVGTSNWPAIVVSTVWVLDSYAKSALYLSTGTTCFTMLRWVSVLGHHNWPVLMWCWQLWTKDCHFKKVSLQELGLWIQLGHKAGKTCWNRGRVAGDDFVVLDINGIHEVGVDFCDCEKLKPEFIQLLRFGWFPASVDCPKTVVTFPVLKHFQLLNFKSKASPFEFYNTLVQLTDNTGLSAPKVYKSAPSCFSQFKHWIYSLGSIPFLLNYCSGILTYKDAEKGNERIWSLWCYSN